MSDPVTTVTGITYDRKSIEQWLTTAAEDAAVCPVTKLPLPRSSDLTPNHMLRRLIQAWCVTNSERGIDRIPTPKAPIHRSLVLKLVRDVNKRNDNLLNINALKRIEELLSECEKNRDCMMENGVGKSVILFVFRCLRNGEFSGFEIASRVLLLTWSPTAEMKQIIEENFEFLQSILGILNSDMENSVKTQALLFLKNATEIMNSNFIERLDSNFFNEMVKFFRMNISPSATKAILRILIQTCPPGRNRMKTVEAGAVFELIEAELGSPEKKTTELIFCLLAHLCSCADGRQQFLMHPGGVAMLAKRLLRVSPATDDRALCIFDSIARFSATRGVMAEMLAVGGVTKLCMVLQASCEGYLKTKAREVLRLHWKAWSNSPCIQVYLLTMYTRS